MDPHDLEISILMVMNINNIFFGQLVAYGLIDNYLKMRSLPRYNLVALICAKDQNIFQCLKDISSRIFFSSSFFKYLGNIYIYIYSSHICQFQES